MPPWKQDEKLCDERRTALDALSDRHVDALRGRLLLARVDAEQRPAPSPARGAAHRRWPREGGHRPPRRRPENAALGLIERHAATHERVDDMLADARLKQQEALEGV